MMWGGGQNVVRTHASYITTKHSFFAMDGNPPPPPGGSESGGFFSGNEREVELKIVNIRGEGGHILGGFEHTYN